MVVELQLQGDALRALQRKLKAMDAKELRRELNKGIREGAKPLVDDARAAARANLPREGGLAERIATKPTAISSTATGVRVRVRGSDATSLDRGILRHPVFGNRDVWVTRNIRPGWFTDAMKREAPKVRPHILAAMERIAEKIARS